ncbi:RICIN domain-containing protein [Streptomyces sp. NPDC046915]|uniref:RICIN domain-containing protein n=1 Tax=Streptomyces sp. NPDC046915 TaxID=3155257 RepID=UPI0033DC76BE
MLDVSDASTVDGGAVIQWRWGGGTNQQWRLWTDDGGDSQSWKRNSSVAADGHRLRSCAAMGSGEHPPVQHHSGHSHRRSAGRRGQERPSVQRAGRRRPVH